MASEFTKLPYLWHEAAWLDALPWAVRAAWPLVIEHVWKSGWNGICAASSVHRWAAGRGIPPECVQELLDAAVTAGIMEIDEDQWRILDWSPYGAESSERVRRFRERQSKGAATPQIEPETTSNTELPTVTECNVSSRENEECNVTFSRETKTKTYCNPPLGGPPLIPETAVTLHTVTESPPGKARKRPVSRKALDSKGDPRFHDAFRRFDEAYPRRGDGGSIKRSDGRLIFDQLGLAGEDLEAVIAGARRYRENLELRQETRYVKAMPTWLNQRCWEESYQIDPRSEIGQQIAERISANAERERQRYELDHQDAYGTFVEAFVEAQITDTMAAEYRLHCEQKIVQRERDGMRSAAKALRAILDDPEKFRVALREHVASAHVTVPTFWQWAKEQGLPPGVSAPSVQGLNGHSSGLTKAGVYAGWAE